MFTNNNPSNNPTPSGNTGGYGNILAGILGAGYDAYKDNRVNKRNIKAENKARAWNRKQWEDINAYNHPTEQMARLAAAGLNPNLIYGSSPGSAVGNAGSVAPGKAPEYKMGNPLSTGITLGQDTMVKQAQTNNLKTQANLNTSNAIKSISQSGLAKAQEKSINKLLAGNLEIQQEEIKQQKIGTFLKTLEKTGKSKNYLAQQAALTNKMIADGETAQAGIELAKLTRDLAKQGIRPTDPLYIRLISQIFGIDFKNPSVEDAKNLKTFIKFNQ